MKLYLDPGHGGSDPGAVGNGLQEKDIALDITRRIEILLKDYLDVVVEMSRSTDVTKSLVTRTNEANTLGVDMFLSIHCNAFNGKARGYEDFVYSGLNKNATSRRYQSIMHATVAKSAALPNRGMKQANFLVLRESRMPAILTENGFIDHPEDAKMMKQAAWREQVALGHVAGLVQIFQLKKNVQNQDIYQVVVGSFRKRSNAEGRVIYLKAKGLIAQIQQVKLDKDIMFRVQVGSFRTKSEAEKQLQKVERAGVRAFVF